MKTESTNYQATIEKINGNIMGTTSILMKVKGMRKSQDFIFYPLQDKEQKIVLIQSDTRIAKLDLSTGKGLISKSHSNGAYNVHLSIDKLTSFTISEMDLQSIKMHVFASQGKSVGDSIVKSNNQGAKNIFDL